MENVNRQKNNWLKLALLVGVSLVLIFSANMTEASLIGAVNNAVQKTSNSTSNSNSSNSSLIQSVNNAVQNISSGCSNCGSGSSNSTQSSTQTTNGCANGSTLSLNEALNAYENGSIGISFSKVSLTQARANVTNNTSCVLPASLLSYKMFDNIDASTQVNIDNSGVTNIPAHSAHVFSVTIAQCLSQIDVFYSQGPTSLPDHGTLFKGIIYGPDGRSFNRVPEAQGLFCSVPPPNQGLNGSCSVTPSSINVGGHLNWSATASGGAGGYTYSWSGTDSLSGSDNAIFKTYSTAGTKTGTVTITSDAGRQSITRSCSAVVNTVPVNNDLSVSCSASPSSVDVDEDVDWNANATGGTGSYSYDWSGTDGLDGSSRYITWSYDDNGTKHATVTVTSGSQTASASCTVRVDEEEEDYDNLNVSCYASPSSPQIGSRMNWYARVDGGDGDYDYDWSGTDGLNSSSRSPYMTYDTPGSKRATVTVTDGEGEEDTATCYANINSVLAFSQVNQTPLLDAVYLSQVPYTGFADNMKLYFFIGMLALFSAWVAYIIIEKKKEMGELN